MTKKVQKQTQRTAIVNYKEKASVYALAFERGSLKASLDGRRSESSIRSSVVWVQCGGHFEMFAKC